MKEISANDNPVIKKFRALSMKKQRDKLGLYIIEGPNLLEEALNGKAKIGQILFDEEALSRSEELAGLARMAEERKIPAAVASPSLFLKASNTDTPQGVIAWVEKPVWTKEQFFAPEGGNIIVLDRLQDPGNLGTIIRTGEGAGIDGVIMTRESVDIYNPKTIRATMGSIYRVPFLYTDNLEQVMEELKKRNVHTYAAHLQGKEYYDVQEFKEGCAFLIGNEGNGLKKETADLAERYIKIPMEGQLESLNAAVATAILMYEAAAQRRRI